MSKPKRGRSIKKTKNWRGTCPICQKTGVKLLWSKVKEDKSTTACCKRCGN